MSRRIVGYYLYLQRLRTQIEESIKYPMAARRQLRVQLPIVFDLR